MGSLSIRTRFTFSLVANILRNGINFSTALLLARWLGPEDYGRMTFLVASFMAFRQLLDMMSSAAFFTFLSQRPRSQSFVNYFWRWIAIQFALSFLFVGVLCSDALINVVWKESSRLLVVLVMVATFIQSNVWSIAARMAEAQRETIKVQQLNALLASVHLIVIIFLWYFGLLMLPLLFSVIAIEWGIAAWFAAQLYRSSKRGLGSSIQNDDTPTSIFREYWTYCCPFIPFVWFSFAHDFMDRWLLQHWGGSSEQAYFAIAQQISGVASLFTMSIMNIYWKEISEAVYNQAFERVKYLYKRVSRGLYFVAAVVAGLFLPWASEIVDLMVGEAYSGSVVTLLLMILYPLHQGVGQVSGILLQTSGHSRKQVLLLTVSMTLGILATYFMLAPSDMAIPGMGLASRGLALKMVIIQIFQVNIMIWIVARIFGWKFDWIYQVMALVGTLASSCLAKLIVVNLLSLPVIFEITLSSIIYFLLIAAFLFLVPWVAGFERREIMSAVRLVR